MFAAFDISNAGEAVVWGAGVVGAVGLLFRFAGTYILQPFARHQDEQRDEQENRNHQHMTEALAPLVSELIEIRQELAYNGGTTTKDAVRRIDQRLTRMEGRFEEHDRFTRHSNPGPDDMEPGL